MKVISRKEFLKDPVYRMIFEAIRDNHKTPKHAQENLIKYQNVKDICNRTRSFIQITGDLPFIHYDTLSWIEKDSIIFRIESIGFYDDFLEYNVARLKQLNSAEQAFIPENN